MYLKMLLVTCACYNRILLVFLIFLFSLSSQTLGNKVTFYQDFDLDGRKLRLDDIYDCTALPAHWHRKISSLDSHDNCLILYDTPFCKGRLIQVKLTEDDPRVIENLKTLGFNDVIKSVKPCPAKHVLPAGAYKIQNVANQKYLTARDLQIVGWTKLKTIKWKKQNSQRWEVQQNPDGTYFLIPLAHLNEFPISYDINLFDREEMANDGVFREREYWNFVYLRGDVAMIQNDDTKECLIMEGSGYISQAPCDRKSKYQQWRFREI